MINLFLILTIVVFSGVEKPERELPAIIELNEMVSFRTEYESWIVSKEFIRMDRTIRDSLHSDALNRLKIIERNYGN